MKIEAKNLVKIYGDRTVVNDISFEVNKGEVVGLLGPNGAGKTTTFYMVVGLVKPNGGQDFLGDKDLTNVPMNVRAKEGIGYLPQEASIFRKLSVEDNIKLVLEMNDKQIPTGRMLDVEGTPQDFRAFRSFRPGIDSEFNHIRDFKGYDHPFVIDGWKPGILGEAGTLREKKSGRTVTVLTSQPSVMIYTGNWLAGGCPETKSGGRYEDYAGVAIECQNYPDAVNHPEFPSPLLHPEEFYCQKIVFRFGVC